MKYEIDYTNLEGQEKINKAMADIESYMGGKRELNKLVKKIKGLPKKSIIMSLSMFLGIEGYPARVLAEKYGV